MLLQSGSWTYFIDFTYRDKPSPFSHMMSVSVFNTLFLAGISGFCCCVHCQCVVYNVVESLPVVLTYILKVLVEFLLHSAGIIIHVARRVQGVLL